MGRLFLCLLGIIKKYILIIDLPFDHLIYQYMRTLIPIATLWALILSLSACQKDQCKDVDCNGNGQCIIGVCDCDEGYEGPNCETIQREKFIGSYRGSESCITGNYDYFLSISSSPTSVAEILINNLFESGESVVARMGSDGYSFVIPSQPMGSSTVSGSGSLSGITITITFSVNLQGSIDNCSLSMF